MRQKMCFMITRLCEKVLRIAFPGGEVENSLKKFSPAALSNEVLKLLYDTNETSDRIFKELNDHLLDLDPMHNHKFLLIRAIAMKYILIRTHFMCNNAFNKTSPRGRFSIS